MWLVNNIIQQALLNFKLRVSANCRAFGVDLDEA